MPDPNLSKILGDLDAHARALDLDGPLGERLVGIARESTQRNFTAAAAPDGTPWPELSSDYRQWKQRYYPGEPIGVRDGAMREGLNGEPELTPGSATWTFGQGGRDREECDWFSAGDPPANRPPRPFVGLDGQGKADAREAVWDHLEKGKT